MAKELKLKPIEEDVLKVFSDISTKTKDNKYLNITIWDINRYCPELSNINALARATRKLTKYGFLKEDYYLKHLPDFEKNYSLTELGKEYAE